MKKKILAFLLILLPLTGQVSPIRFLPWLANQNNTEAAEPITSKRAWGIGTLVSLIPTIIGGAGYFYNKKKMAKFTKLLANSTDNLEEFNEDMLEEADFELSAEEQKNVSKDYHLYLVKQHYHKLLAELFAALGITGLAATGVCGYNWYSSSNPDDPTPPPLPGPSPNRPGLVVPEPENPWGNGNPYADITTAPMVQAMSAPPAEKDPVAVKND